MGYFSELDYMQHEEAEWSSAEKVQQLTDQIHHLNESLIDLESQYPRDMLNPEYDHKFYSECLTGNGDDMDTIQGVLHNLRKTKELLRIAEAEERQELEKQQERMEWRNTVLETGATPDYQIVLPGVFFLVADHSAAA